MAEKTRAPRINRASDPLTHAIIGCAMKVHETYGPGLRESVYENCLAVELDEAGLEFTRQTAVDLTHRGVSVGKSFRPDFIVDRKVVVELKSVPEVTVLHMKQLRSYLAVSGLELGLIINFNVEYLVKGVRRITLKKKDAEH